MDFNLSKTKENLMKAFVGESQARNRYSFAADIAKAQSQHFVKEVFLFTANQEKEHAEIFYNFLSPFSKENIEVKGTYPINISSSVLDLLQFAKHNEYEEWEIVYRDFGEIAMSEGFTNISEAFFKIAEIEKSHGDRFDKLYRLIRDDRLYRGSENSQWLCLNCGHIHYGNEAPKICPVCHHAIGYFMPVDLDLLI